MDRSIRTRETSSSRSSPIKKIGIKEVDSGGGDEINQSQKNLGFGAVRIENSIDDSSFDRGF